MCYLLLLGVDGRFYFFNILQHTFALLLERGLLAQVGEYLLLRVDDGLVIPVNVPLYLIQLLVLYLEFALQQLGITNGVGYGILHEGKVFRVLVLPLQ